uniref:EF-hand domain-containing protein n=1 Tax=Ascaris lumbricoides TaxID=6252 RepID=A0A0M3I239_ASCLU
MSGEWLYWVIIPVFITVSLLGSYSFSRVKNKKRLERSHVRGRSSHRQVHAVQQEQKETQSQQSSSKTTERTLTTSLTGSLSRVKTSSQGIVKDGKIKNAPSADDDERTEFEEVGVVKRPAICKTRIVLKWKQQAPLKRKSERTSQSSSRNDSEISESRSRSKKSTNKRKINDTQRIPSDKSRGTLDKERSMESSEGNSRKRTQRSSRSTKGNRQQIDINISRVFDVPTGKDALANKIEHLEKTIHDSAESIGHSKADSRYTAKEMQHEIEIPASRKSTTEKKSYKPQRIAKIRKKKFEESQIFLPRISDATLSDASISLKPIDDSTTTSTAPSKSPISSSSSSSSQYSKMASVDKSIDTADVTGSYRGNSAPSINGNTKRNSLRIEQDKTEVTSESRKRKERKDKRQDEATVDTGKLQSGGQDRKSVMNEASTLTVLPSQNRIKEREDIVNEIKKQLDESEPFQDSKISSTQSEKESEQKESGKENKQSNEDIRKAGDVLLRRKEEQKHAKKERKRKEIRKKSTKQERRIEEVKDKTETRKQSAEGSDEHEEKLGEGVGAYKKKVDEVCVDKALAKVAQAQKTINYSEDSKQEGNDEEGETKCHIASAREKEAVKSSDEIIIEKKDKIMNENMEAEKHCESSEQHQDSELAQGSSIAEKHPQQQLTLLSKDMPFVSSASSSFASPRMTTQEKSSPMNCAERSENVISQTEIDKEHTISSAESRASFQGSAHKVKDEKHERKADMKKVVAESDVKKDESNTEKRRETAEKFVDDHTVDSETESTGTSDTPSFGTLRDINETVSDKYSAGSMVRSQQNIEKKRETEKEESSQTDDTSETVPDKNSSGCVFRGQKNEKGGKSEREESTQTDDTDENSSESVIRLQQNIEKERKREEEESTQTDDTSETVSDENSSGSVIRSQEKIEKERETEREESTQVDDKSVGKEDESQEDDEESTDTQHRKVNSDPKGTPRRIAGQVLDIINKNNFFMNTVTHDQDVLLKGFFASEVKFDEDVESAIFVALNLAIERVICTALNQAQRQFLSQRKAKGTIETKQEFRENNSPSSPTQANEKQD